MTGTVRCACCNLPIPVTADDVGLAVTCPRTRKLVPVKETALPRSAPATRTPAPRTPASPPLPSRPPEQTPRPAVPLASPSDKMNSNWPRVVVVGAGVLMLAGLGVYAVKSLWSDSPNRAQEQVATHSPAPDTPGPLFPR